MKKTLVGFDCEKYVNLQTQKILERVSRFNNKLYLEFGGKLFDDYHASRVLPGFYPDVKIKVLEKLKDKLEIIFCVSAVDIENGRIRGDSGLTYDLEAIRCIAELRKIGLSVNNIVITLFKDQPKAIKFANFLKVQGEKVTIHRFTKGYAGSDTKTVVSDQGLGANPFIKTTKPIVLINAPGAKSGKLGVSLCQLYHEFKRGVKAGYAKFETFPVWDLPINHPVNLAYEAATADLNDKLMIDNFHLKRYGISAVNYNRDAEAFPMVQSVLKKITNENCYESPTDMGFSSVGASITNDKIVRAAAKSEIERRFFRYKTEAEKGISPHCVAQRVVEIAKKANIKINTKKTSPTSDFTQIANQNTNAGGAQPAPNKSSKGD